MKTLKDYEYFRTENGVLYCGDNMEILPLITERIDLCLTDPPYGINIEKMAYANNENKKASKKSMAKSTAYNGGFKDDKIDIKPLLNYPKQIIWGGNYYSDVLPFSKSWLIWDKRTDDKYSNDFADGEIAYSNLKCGVRIFRFLWSGMIQGDMKNKEERFHPTQKPIPLLIWCIEKSDTAGIILDPFLGSGTTALACEKLNRKWIGIEISEKYCEIAKKRIEQYTNQLKLFK